jgi:hypothetical protein
VSVCWQISEEYDFSEFHAGRERVERLLHRLDSNL